jgi:predicted nucleic acid-binding protein
MPVVDASIFGKLLFLEPDSAQARALVMRGGVVAPPSLRIELVNLIRRVAKAKHLDIDAAAQILDDQLVGVEFEPDTPELGRATLEIALALDHAAQDCAYLAVARRLGAPLVTTDAVFARKARRHGHDVRGL